MSISGIEHIKTHPLSIGRDVNLVDRCPECQGTLKYDHRHWETYCEHCGLIDDHSYAQKLTWDAEPDDLDDDNWLAEAMITAREDGSVDSGLSNEPMQIRLGNGVTKEFFPYTHAKFVRTGYRRCNKRPEDKCNYHGGLPSEQCRGCKYAVETSLYEREHGLKGVPPELSYPEVCCKTLQSVPAFGPWSGLSDREISKHLVNIRKEERARGIFRKGGISPPSVGKYRKNRDLDWGWRDIVDKMSQDNPTETYLGTPIGDLLQKAPRAGRDALIHLRQFSEASKGAPNDFQLAEAYSSSGVDVFAPTRVNLLTFFMSSDHSKSLAKKWYDILVSSEVIVPIKRFTDIKKICYLDGACDRLRFIFTYFYNMCDFLFTSWFRIIIVGMKLSHKLTRRYSYER